MVLFSYVVQIKVTSINTGNTCQPLGTSYLTEIMISETVYMLLYKKKSSFYQSDKINVWKKNWYISVQSKKFAIVFQSFNENRP